jgi:hypothetical protein
MPGSIGARRFTLASFARKVNAMDIHSRPVLIYRWCVFLAAAGYCLYQMLFGNYDDFGGPFRFLTIWALFLSFYVSSRMLALSERRITRPHEVTAMCASVLNVMVVYLYWQLYFNDPSSVTGSRGVPVWHQQYYLHGLGPALQIIDALLIGRVFRRVHRAIVPLVLIVAVYVLWVEGIVQRLSDSPVGDVTSGLPYPFLNDLELAGRATFYASNAAVAIVLLGVFGALGWLIYRSSAKSAASPSR